MRFSIAALIVVLSAGCFPAGPRPPMREARSAPVATVVEPPAPRMPTAPVAAPRFLSSTVSAVVFEGVLFDSRDHRLLVVDQKGGPGSSFADAADAARSKGGMAAINAGFFTPEGAPLGLVVSQGTPTGAWNSASSLGSGVWFEDGSGSSAIVRSEKLGRSAALRSRELMQAGPMLRENGSSVGGLDPIKNSARTLILWDGGTRWWIGRTSPCSLLALGEALAAGSPTGWPVRHALNLDGGRSSDLWVSATVPGGPILRRPPWNRPVRNFLVLVAR